MESSQRSRHSRSIAVSRRFTSTTSSRNNDNDDKAFYFGGIDSNNQCGSISKIHRFVEETTNSSGGGFGRTKFMEVVVSTSATTATPAIICSEGRPTGFGAIFQQQPTPQGRYHKYDIGYYRLDGITRCKGRNRSRCDSKK
jgi:hypothetical protein